MTTANPDAHQVIVKANVTQRTSATDPGTNYCQADTTVFNGGAMEMTRNSEYQMGTSVLFELDNEHYDYNFATIKLWVYIHEYDTGGFPCYCNDERIEKFITVPSGEFGDNPHKIIMNVSGARFRFEISIEMANKPL